MRSVGGTPIEEAPVWALALLVVVLWLVIFPALVGLLNGVHLVAGGGFTVAAAAAAVSLLLVVGLARQQRWRRPATPSLEGAASLEDAASSEAAPPLFARFSTWLLATLLVPNVLFGALILGRGGEGFSYLSAWVLGLMVSTIHGLFALADRRRRARP